jgi:hypothetical protein
MMIINFSDVRVVVEDTTFRRDLKDSLVAQFSLNARKTSILNSVFPLFRLQSESLR